MSTLSCAECAAATEAPSEPVAAALVVLAAHAGPHPKGHALGVSALPEGECDLSLECLAGCKREPRAIRVRTPRDLVMVHALLFHSLHEGHTMRVTLDGRDLTSEWRPCT